MRSHFKSLMLVNFIRSKTIFVILMIVLTKLLITLQEAKKNYFTDTISKKVAKIYNLKHASALLTAAKNIFLNVYLWRRLTKYQCAFKYYFELV